MNKTVKDVRAVGVSGPNPCKYTVYVIKKTAADCLFYFQWHFES